MSNFDLQWRIFLFQNLDVGRYGIFNLLRLLYKIGCVELKDYCFIWLSFWEGEDKWLIYI